MPDFDRSIAGYVLPGPSRSAWHALFISSVPANRLFLSQLFSLFPGLCKCRAWGARSLRNPDLEYRWQARTHGALECRHELRRGLDPFAMRTERPRVRDEI